MAEICYGMVNEEETRSPCKPSSRAARRRRMEIRRFKFIAGVGTPSELVRSAPESGGKRQKVESGSSSSMSMSMSMSPRQCDNAVENCGGSLNGLKEESLGGSKLEDNSPCASRAIEAAVRCPRFGVLSVCGRRRDMEDAVSIFPSFFRRGGENPVELHFFGVYDGHGCSHVAMSCKDRLHQFLAEELETSHRNEQLSSESGGDRQFSPEWNGLMQRSFTRMDKEVISENVSLSTNCRCELQTQKCDAVGSTAVVAVVTPDRIVVANCGDSRAVLCRNGKPIPLSTDHKPDRPDELLRIQAAGGRVIYWDGPRVLGVLAMSRAIGDNYLKPYVTSNPEVTITERLPDDDCLILASDGLWDVFENEVACDIARRCLRGQTPKSDVNVAAGKDSNTACSDAAALLTKLALARQSSDNVSVVVIDLKRDA